MNFPTPNLEQLPYPAETNIALHIHNAAEQALRRGHPWVFENSIVKQSQPGKPGDLAVIFDYKRKFLAIGIFDPASPIRVRILQHHQPAQINRQWFQERFHQAINKRSQLPDNTSGYRVIHGENDGLPALVLDRYDQTLVMKIYTAAWIPFLRDLIPLCFDLSPKRIILRLGRKTQRHPEHLYGLKDGQLLWGSVPKGPLKFLENGITFEVDPVRGQKTGFFLDQRDNRSIVETLAGGQTVLNVFAYTGGFSLYAARGGAKSVTSVDISQPALATAERNFHHNQKHPSVAAATHQTLAGDAFEILTILGDNKQSFDMVIIDPPSFANNKKEITPGLRAYRRLTRLGLQVLRPGGIFIQASCSSRISSEQFFAAVHREADLMNRKLKEIQRTSHPIDHPIGFPEGAYLKCLFAEA